MLISSNIKEKILNYIIDILKIDDPFWSSLDIEIKLKIIHNFCNIIKLNSENINYNVKHLVNNTNIKIPLKNQRPKKIIELSGINKQNNIER
jgi:hypothetical protein